MLPRNPPRHALSREVDSTAVIAFVARSSFLSGSINPGPFTRAKQFKVKIEVWHREGAVSMSTRAHRGTSRVFWKPIRAPECRPDRQKCRPDQSASHALALPRTRREPQCKRGPGQVDAIVARADAATNALGSPAEHTEGCSTGTLRRHPRHRLPRGFPGLTHDRLRIGGLYR